MRKPKALCFSSGHRIECFVSTPTRRRGIAIFGSRIVDLDTVLRLRDWLDKAIAWMEDES